MLEKFQTLVSKLFSRPKETVEMVTLTRQKIAELMENFSANKETLKQDVIKRLSNALHRPIPVDCNGLKIGDYFERLYIQCFADRFGLKNEDPLNVIDHYSKYRNEKTIEEMAEKMNLDAETLKKLMEYVEKW